MSIPSADHTIYSFITLCLKEQGDIAGRKEITAQHRGGWEKKKKKKSRMPSSTETYLCDRFTAQEQGFYLGGGRWESVGVPLCSATPPVHCTRRGSKLQHLPPCGGSRIQFLTYPPDDQICSTVAVAFTAPLPPCHHAFLEVTGRTDRGGGGGLRQGRADRKGGGWSAFFTTESWVPLDRADASSYFLAALTSGLLFPLIRVQCSR